VNPHLLVVVLLAISESFVSILVHNSVSSLQTVVVLSVKEIILVFDLSQLRLIYYHIITVCTMKD
jgi:hypothetical protein